MARLLRSLQRALGLTAPSRPASPSITPRSSSIDTDFAVFREGDRAIIQGKNLALTKPLKHGGKTNLRRGHIDHDRIIGSRVWDTIQAHKGADTRFSLPTLEEYVTLTPRHVTPIYSHDANLIVSLLDIHVNPPAHCEKKQPIEILESGTGHGSLTLHLARALQAANTVPPPRPSQSQIQYVQNRNRSPQETEKQDKKAQESDPEVQQEWDSWRAERGAVIHTVDVSSKFAKLAEENVQGFRRGIYRGTVDFYVGAVEEWIDEQVARRSKTQPAEPFLDYAILDMPSAHERIPFVKNIIKRDGRMVVFSPSITQIGDCVKTIHGLPGSGRSFVLEKVVELGSGMTSGRYWDVRLAMKKSAADPSTWDAAAEGEEAAQSSEVEEPSETLETSTQTSKASDAAPREIDEQNAVMVCRPKVGLRTFGGGFVGVWRRVEGS